MKMCVYTGGCIEKGKASRTERWRKQSHLGSPDLVLGARHHGRKKRRDRERRAVVVVVVVCVCVCVGGGCAPQGRAIVKGKERGVIGCSS